MSKALTEFQRFLQSQRETLSSHERKLARLILDNFSEISSCGAAGGRRGRLIAKLVEDCGATVSEDVEIEVGAMLPNGSKVLRLSAIKLEDFRGFSLAQKLEFKNLYTFVYGPNGTGKSSLCEGLEFALLGSISEASTKRIDTAAYIKNSITGKSKAPVLFAETIDGAKNVIVAADSKTYEFCFIEKNRIEGFARVAANTAAAQQARLAALFGLDEFNLFATQFNESLENYLDCIGKKSQEYAKKEKTVVGQKTVLSQTAEKSEEIKQFEEGLLLKHVHCKTLDEIRVWAAGLDGNGGVVKANHAKIAKLNGLKPAGSPQCEIIKEEILNLRGLIEERRLAYAELHKYKDQLSLGELYAAILKNKAHSGEICPACKSTLYIDGELMVPIDPYHNAEIKIKEFEVAIKCEARIKSITDQLTQRWSKLELKANILSQVARYVEFARTNEIEEIASSVHDVTNSKTLESALTSLTERFQLLDQLGAAVEIFNQTIAQSKPVIKSLEEENAMHVKLLEDIAAIKATKVQNEKSATAAKSEIDKFNKENEELIKLVEAERQLVLRNIQFAEAYVSFREKLLKYNIGLPLSLASNLNEKTLKFYNAINRHDHPSDRLKSLSLPTAAGQRLEIVYVDGKACDALHVLSEGHIRCLGLSILLSKIVQDDLPFLIFDDVVNSIDDEHRTGIVELLLGDEEICKRQLIITTHGEDFVKRLENAVPKASYKDTVCRIDFLVPMESKRILIKLDSPRHYLIVAEQSYNDGRIRDCLSYVRKSFEELLNRLWKKIGNKSFSVQIQVGLRAPGGMPDLMALANGLHTFLSKKEITVYQAVIPLLANLTGRQKTHAVEWAYLNKGTHEENKEEEFDPVLVREMLITVMEIDAAIEADGKGLHNLSQTAAFAN